MTASEQIFTKFDFFFLRFMGNCRPEERIPNLIMDWIPREKRKRGRRRKREWSTSSYDDKKIQIQINGETEKNCVWFPEDGDSC